MRICLDIDGVICRLREPGQSYADLEPVPGAVARLQSLKAAGHYVILMTARHMKTCGGNPGMAVARQGKTLLEWLERQGIVYDEIWFGKPQADVYVDDNGFRFESWDGIAADGGNLPVSREVQKQRS
jgi:capsule biosynthesis phosphatase